MPFILLIAMRLLLFIPVLILFLSNVPFVQQLPLEQAISMMKDGSCGHERECSRSSENLDATCSKDEPDCEQSCTDESKEADPANDKCCQQIGTTCVCILCFQYAAPAHTIAEYVFDCSLATDNTSDFLVGHIKDPHIGAPWQPPDLV